MGGGQLIDDTSATLMSERMMELHLLMIPSEYLFMYVYELLRPPPLEQRLLPSLLLPALPPIIVTGHNKTKTKRAQRSGAPTATATATATAGTTATGAIPLPQTHTKLPVVSWHGRAPVHHHCHGQHCRRATAVNDMPLARWHSACWHCRWQMRVLQVLLWSCIVLLCSSLLCRMRPAVRVRPVFCC